MCYELLYFFGYREKGIDELVKLYDIESDPEELADLSASAKDVADTMLEELKAQIAKKDKPSA